MKFSRYNHLFTREDKYFVYNSLTNSFAQVGKEIYKLLKKGEDTHYINDNQEILDDETMKLLKDMKVIDANDDVECNSIKFKSLSQRFNTNYLSLTINPTLSCNFCCPYCFEVSHDSIYMNDEVEDEIIRYIKRFANIKNLYVTWFGGEPLMAFERIKTLTHKILDLNINYHSGMITNGYLLSEEVIRQLSGLKIETIQITLDGNADTHNKRRCLKGGYPTFSKIIDNIKLSQQLSPQTRINVRVNIDKTNEREFVDLYDKFAKLNLPNLIVYPGFVIDISGNDDNCGLFDNLDISGFLNDTYCKHGIYLPMMYPDGNVSSCSVRHAYSTIIGPKGEFYKCWNDVGNKEKVYGSLSDGIINKEIFLKYVMDADNLTDPICDNCKFMPICNGGCPYVRIQEKDKGKGCEKACILFKNNPDDFLWNYYN